MTNHSRRRFLRLTGVAVAAGIAGCNGNAGLSAPQNGGSATDASTAASEPTATATGTDTESAASSESAYSAVYEETIGSILLVSSSAGEGTGFVYDDTHVVTNAHVVEDDDEVDVRFWEGEWETAGVVGTDVYSDLAVIRVSNAPSYATPLPLLEGHATVGEEVIVIGNPYGLDGTVTAGIVSGVNRSIDAGTGYSIPDSVQTDAAVNPGNSGGPIVSLDGEVIAIVNAAGGDNLAFGISAALVRRVVPALLEDGSYEHAYMGASLADVTPELASANGVDSASGVYVTRVFSDGPADGVLRGSDGTTVVDGYRVPTGGDVIRALDGEAVLTVDDLSSYLALRKSPGDALSLTVLRDGTERTVEMELGARPAV